MPSLTKLEVRSGAPSGAGRGALLGGLVAAGVGFFGAAAGCEDGFLFSTEECVVMATATLAVLGAVIGAGIGALTADPWSDLPLQSLAFGLTRDREWTVGGSIRF